MWSGSRTAPNSATATWASRNCQEFGKWTATTAPLPMPRSCRPRARAHRGAGAVGEQDLPGVRQVAGDDVAHADAQFLQSGRQRAGFGPPLGPGSRLAVPQDDRGVTEGIDSCVEDLRQGPATIRIWQFGDVHQIVIDRYRHRSDPRYSRGRIPAAESSFGTADTGGQHS